MSRSRDDDEFVLLGVPITGKNPFDAALRMAEHLPVVNNVIQEGHRITGNTQALHRAKERNPLGANGYITQIGEQVPLLNDGIAALHALKGNEAAAERAHAKSLQRLLSKDGAITKVAEVLPGTNIIAAIVHEAAGRPEEAQRAMDLLRNWREVGSPDGPLAKVAEIFPGTDLIAFAVHMNANNFPQALRSITKTKWVKVHLSTLVATMDVVCLGNVSLCDIKINSLEIEPKSASLMGAVCDMSAHFLDMDASGRHRRQHQPQRARIDTELTEGFDMSKTFEETSKLKANEFIWEATAKTCERMPMQCENMLTNTNARLDDLLERKPFLRMFLPTALDMLPEQLVSSLSNFAVDIAVTHEPLQAPTAVRARPAPNKQANGIQECIGAASCVCCAGYLGCGLGIKVGAAGCLAGIYAAGVQLNRIARKKFAPWLNTRNASVWTSAQHKDSEVASATASSQRGTSSSSSSVRKCKPAGVMFELPRQHCEALEEPHGRSYLLGQFLPGHLQRRVARYVEPLMRRWITSTLENDEEVMYLVFEASTKEQVRPVSADGSVCLQIPSIDMLVWIDLSPRGTGAGHGPVVRRARVSISDAQINHALDAVVEQARSWDLRDLDPRFSGFTQPVQAQFNADLRWSGPGKVEAVVSDFNLDVHLPH